MWNFVEEPLQVDRRTPLVALHHGLARQFKPTSHPLRISQRLVAVVGCIQPSENRNPLIFMTMAEVRIFHINLGVVFILLYFLSCEKMEGTVYWRVRETNRDVNGGTLHHAK